LYISNFDCYFTSVGHDMSTKSSIERPKVVVSDLVSAIIKNMCGMFRFKSSSCPASDVHMALKSNTCEVYIHLLRSLQCLALLLAGVLAARGPL